MAIKIPGDVFGPSSSTAGNLPTFSGATGKILQDSGKAVDDSGSTVNDIWTAAKIIDYIATVTSGLDWQPSVLGYQSTPPVGPTSGDRYIVEPTGTGDWAGQDNAIAEWDGSAWAFTAPNEGYAATVEDENLVRYFNASSWVVFSSIIDHSQLQNLTTGDPHTQYQLRSEKDTASGYVGLDGSSNVSVAGTVTAASFSDAASVHSVSTSYTQADNTAATDVIAFASATYQAARVRYVMRRGTTKARSGLLNVVHVNGNVTISDTADDEATGGALGITWTAAVDGANIDIRLAVDASSVDDVFLTYDAQLLKVYA